MQIKEQYDKDPMDVASFIPPVRSVSGATTAAAAGAAPGAGTGVGVGAERGKGPGPSSSITAAVAAAAADKPLEKNEYLDAITACFENLAVEVARLESAGGTSGPTTSTSASAFDERPHHTRDCKPSSSPTVVPALPPRDSRDKLSDGGVPLATVVPATTTDGASSSGGEPELDSAQIEALNVQLQSIKAEEVKDKDIHLYDQFQYW